MPDPKNPLNALQKASSISAGPQLPWQDQNGQDLPLSVGVMPGVPAGGFPALMDAVKAAPEAVEGLARAVPSIQQLSPATNAVMNRMYQAANPVFKGLQEAGQFIGDRTTGALKALPSFANTAQETLGEANPEFTPQGGESLYNLGKTALKTAYDPVETAYKSIMLRGGR